MNEPRMIDIEESKANTLLIRADASAQMGVGHVMRCMALGQAWQDALGQVVFVMSGETPSIAPRLHAEKMRVEMIPAKAGSPEDAQATLAHAEALNAPWIVIDGYQFDSQYQKLLKSSGRKVLWIDDYGHAAPYCADIVLNQNLSASEELYEKRQAATRLLLGTRYALLRREFREQRDLQREIPEKTEKILVTLGGSDPDNITLKVIEWISLIDRDNLSVRVIAGVANPHLDALRQAASQSPKKIEIQSNVTDMLGQMAWADLAISAGGSTCWEMARMGLPNAILILADNQRPIAEYLDKTGVSVNLGWLDSLSENSIVKKLLPLIDSREKRTDMAEKGRQLINGRGAEEVVKIISES